MVEGYLNPKGKPMDATAGMGLCMDLGVLYLDGNRLPEADAHFTRLEKMNDLKVQGRGAGGQGHRPGAGQQGEGLEQTASARCSARRAPKEGSCPRRPTSSSRARR